MFGGGLAAKELSISDFSEYPKHFLRTELLYRKVLKNLFYFFDILILYGKLNLYIVGIV